MGARGAMRMIAAAILLCFSMFAAHAQEPEAQQPDTVVDVASDDAVMNAAIAQARSYLPDVFRMYDRFKKERVEGDVQFKVGLDTQSGSEEHIFVGQLRREGALWSGALANNPRDLGALKLGDRVTFESDRISDWLLPMPDGRLAGGFTIRVLVANLPADQKEAILAGLTPDPVPEIWKAPAQ